MRIVGGRHRGLALAALGKGDPGGHLRPTSDRVRESLFNVLQGGRFADPIAGARVLDLFAGTGALGLEALSRGARHCTFVDSGRKARDLIAENLARAGRGGDATILIGPAGRLGPVRDGPASLVFLDPPYGKGAGRPAIDSARAGGWIAPGAVVVWEEAAPMEAPEGFSVLDRRRYGQAHLTILELASGPATP